MNTKVATAVLTHAHPELTADTVDAIETWVGDRVLVLVDKAGWPKFQDVRIGGARVEPGLLHNHNRSPYRNSAVALRKLYENWPDSDWFLYTEYDCLFTSDAFKADLSRAKELNAWCVGFDLRRFEFRIPLLQSLLAAGRIPHSYYMLGCCMFFSREFVAKLYKTGFIERLIHASRDFPKGTFPGYPRWAFEEELWPTVAARLGGSLYELACFKSPDENWHKRYTDDPRMLYAEADGDTQDWRGRHARYGVRFTPEIRPVEMRAESAILHPAKELNNPIRNYHRQVRDAMRNGTFMPAAPVQCPLKLNLGSGSTRLPGYVNVDQCGTPDVKWDLQQCPWPWPDNSVDEVILCHVLDRLGGSPETFFDMVKELYRICKHGAVILITVTHPLHASFISDPTHCRALTVESFESFSKAKCREWKSTGVENTPLALHLDVDFQITHAAFGVEQEPNSKPVTPEALAQMGQQSPSVRAIRIQWAVNKPPLQMVLHPAATQHHANARKQENAAA